MYLKGKFIAILLVLPFSIGLVLGINTNKNHGINNQEKKQNITPDKIVEKDAKIDESYHKTLRDTEDWTNDLNSEIKYPPDEQYYKKARILQKQFPNSFVMSYPTDKKIIALTFDDGPDNRTTPQILDILGQYEIPATFFVVGKNTENHMAVMKRMIEEGHQVANHSWSHLRPTDLTNHDFISEVLSVEEMLKKHIRLSQPLYYRPPYGLLTPDQIRQISDRGYIIISWSIDSLDWAGSKSEEIRDKVLDSAYPGAIILMHCAGGKDGRLETVKALPEMINGLIGQGYEFVTIDVLLDKR